MKWIGAALGLCLLTLAGAALALGLTRLGDGREAALTAQAAQLRQQAEALRSRIALWQAAGATLMPPDDIAGRYADAASGALEVQRALTELSAETGLTLTTIGTAPPAQLSQPVVSVELEATGSLESAARFLAGLERIEPRLAVSQMAIRAAPGGSASDAGSRVAMRIVVWGFWLPGGEVPG